MIYFVRVRLVYSFTLWLCKWLSIIVRIEPESNISTDRFKLLLCVNFIFCIWEIFNLDWCCDEHVNKQLVKRLTDARRMQLNAFSATMNSFFFSRSNLISGYLSLSLSPSSRYQWTFQWNLMQWNEKFCDWARGGGREKLT